jgi:outer membrane immunogenic protein
MRTLAIAAATLLPLVGGAMAADIPVKAPYRAPPPPVLLWTGFYVGANGGYGWDNRTVDFTADPNFFAPAIALGNLPAQLSPSGRGGLGGVQAGFNYQIGAGLVGIEADFDAADIRGSAAFLSANGNYTTTADRRDTSIGTVRARAGFLPWNSMLLYVTGGLAYGNTKVAISVTPTAGCGAIPGCLAATSSGMTAGWTVGAGAEWMFAPAWSFKAEYLYIDIGNRSATVVSAFAGAPNFYTGTTNFRENIVRAGINYHFGGPAVVAKY